ncbi:MAG TPA: PKD domain-containing protein [Candidatus Sulfomarinibacteraceae bacterium]|nr:PKD domain-containing protein [Candidatus Sulfomarinibacteraceae bacterium]
MNRKTGPRYLLLLLVLLLPTLLFSGVTPWPSGVLRGKAAALPLPAQNSPEQALAQELALSDARVQAHVGGSRAEVFGVRRLTAGQHTAASRACATRECRQVEIYLFEANAAVVAIVDLQAEAVLDVLYQRGVQPGINQRLAQRAEEIALNAPEVIEALGFRPLQLDMPPVPGDLLGTVCDHDRLCAAPNFQLGDRILWAVVDLHDEELAGLIWTDTEPEPSGNAMPRGDQECPAPGSVSRDGWTLSYATTPTDGLRVYDVSYEGMSVLTSVKHPEWHADYGQTGFRDSTGCEASSGFHIPPYGETEVLTLYDEQEQETGFEVVQDFRTNQWGATCDYRYEARMQFYDDGRFRVASAVYGRGCSPDVMYRPVVRIHLAIDGNEGDYLSYWDGDQWATAETELYRVPYEESGDGRDTGSGGPHRTTDQGYAWRANDHGGAGYFIVADEGQYEHSRGDDPFLYFTRHHEEEGDTDMGGIGSCCNDDHRQGPDRYVDGEAIDGANVVLWYVPQMQTVADEEAGDYYCWTVSGEPDPETHPCITGPLFVPSDPQEATRAAFATDQPVMPGLPLAFHNQSSGVPPLSYTWDFGDGSPPSHDRNPSHTYQASGTYTVTLTAGNNLGSHTTTAVVEIPPPPEQRWFPFVAGE